jgi:uncharacterized membrane protein
MRTLMTLLSGVSLGAGAMYLMDPDRGDRRRAELRDALEEMSDSELVARARQLEPLATMRELGGGLATMRQLGSSVAAARQFGRGMAAARQLGGLSALLEPSRWGMARGRGWRRQRLPVLAGRDWALLGGLMGAIAAGLWLARRAANSGDIEVMRTMTVDAPVERVYEFWNDFENFPRFMSHVREIRRVGPDRTHWIVAGPGGAPIEWDAVVTKRVPSEEIGWRTVEGSLVEHTGTVRFRPAGNGATRVEVSMSYRPVGGALGHGLASLFGRDPERVIGKDLSRLATQLRDTRAAAVGEAG